MTKDNADTLRTEYLARLDEAMRDLPHGVAVDIRGGIVEELDGLDASATAERIARLGDPAGIAREARLEVPAEPAFVAAPAVPRPPTTATRGFATTAALTLSFGGFLLPALGWFVGVALVCASSLWKTWEKIVAIAVPFVVTGLTLLIVGVLTGFGSETSGGGSSGTGADQVNNPLLPSLAGWHVLVLLGLLLVPASGLWLLWRLRSRPAR